MVVQGGLKSYIEHIFQLVSVCSSYLEYPNLFLLIKVSENYVSCSSALKQKYKLLWVTRDDKNCLVRWLMCNATEQIPRWQREYVEEIIVTRILGKIPNGCCKYEITTRINISEPKYSASYIQISTQHITNYSGTMCSVERLWRRHSDTYNDEEVGMDWGFDF